jgi:DNA (cytosine-5)-methyltransferase 1
MKRQCSLHEFLRRATAKTAPSPSPSSSDVPLQFVDLFCGMGGASQGAVEAGCKVVLAVDSWGEALRVHALNHRGGGVEHICTPLPSVVPLPLPAEGTRWHCHGSPPCTMVSRAQYPQDPDQEDVASALGLIRWYVQFAIDSGATTWTMEQVATPPVRKALDEMRARGSRYRPHLDYEVVDFATLGVPQHRRRIIAGTPRLISKLRRAQRPTRGIRDVIAPLRGTHVRGHMRWSTVKRVSAARPRALTEASTNNSQFCERVAKEGKYVYRHYGLDECCVPVSEPAVCVLASKPILWATPGTNTKPTTMTPRELALLQTFPASYRLDATNRRAVVQVGNALPPLVMRLLLQGEATLDPAPPALPALPALPAPSAPPLSPSLRH